MDYNIEDINDNLKGFAITINKITDLKDALTENINSLETIKNTLDDNTDIKKELTETQKNLNEELSKIQEMFLQTHESNLKEFKSKTDDRFNDILSALERTKDNINDYLRNFSESLTVLKDLSIKIETQLKTEAERFQKIFDKLNDNLLVQNDELKRHVSNELKYLKPGLITLVGFNIVLFIITIVFNYL